VRKMEIEGQTFANRVLMSLERRLRPYMPYYMAFEMIKIDCPDKTLKDPGAIAARKVLCQGWKLDYSKVEKELTAIRGYIQDNLYGKQEQAAKDNLLAFLNGHVARHGEFWATKPNAMRYIGRVITTSVTSHFVEQLFSTLKHETTGKRVNTKVETVAHYLHQEHADDQRRARSRGRQFSNRTATAATLAVNASKFKFVESGSFFF
jgi:hypothetical protein